MPNFSTIRAELNSAVSRLTRAAVDAPRLSAELLLAETLGLSRVQLLIHTDDRLEEMALARFEALIRRRESGEPVAYILGRREFFGRMFAVNPATLVPRPETELLIEAALAAPELPAAAPVYFVDLCTGSGCIGVTLALERPAWRGLAADLSGGALAMAAANVRGHGAADRLGLILADITLPLLAPDAFDLIVSNPPYITPAEYPALSREVRDFEPPQALVPGGLAGQDPSGLELEAVVVQIAAQSLKKGGVLLIEHGAAQIAGMKMLFKNNTWSNVYYYNDLSGKSRFVKAIKN